MGCSISTISGDHKVGVMASPAAKPSRSLSDKVAFEKFRHLRLDSWKRMLMDSEMDSEDRMLSGMSLFCRDFNQANEALGGDRLHITRCRVTPCTNNSEMLSLLTIMRRLMAINTESPLEMDTIRALGRKHSLVDRQDRIGPLFDLLMSTISKRLYRRGRAEVLIAWRLHFDILRLAMTRDKIRLYPELHSRRVSSSHSHAVTEAPSVDENSGSSRVPGAEDLWLSSSSNDSSSTARRPTLSSDTEEQIARAFFDCDCYYSESSRVPLPNFKLLEISDEIREIPSIQLPASTHLN